MRVNLHEDVLLPCQGAYSGDFTLEYLVITWQRSENNTVVHSFYHGGDQPGYQEEECKGRTQLFPGGFQEGNASLLLKDVRESDAGSYTCHYILHDRDAYTPQHVVLQVQTEETHGADDGNRRFLYLLLLAVPVALIAAFVPFVPIRKNRMRKMKEDEESLLTNPDLYGPIKFYRNEVHKTEAIGWKSTRPGEDEHNVHLRRRFHTSAKNLINWMEQERKPECSDKKKLLERTEFAFDENEIIVDSEDLFTDETLELISERMLIIGDVGIGKSCFSKGLLKQWASGQRDLCYECIIYMTFSELNTTKGPLSVRSLLESKYPGLSAALTELLNTDKVLLILDGLDEFNQELKVSSAPDAMCDIDTPLDISTLISKVISRKLLPETHVLITSRMASVRKIREHFTSTFILEAFTENQVQEYCQKFLSGDDRTKAVSEIITNYKLCSLLSVPLLSSALRHIYKKGPCPQSEGALATRSRMVYSLLQVSLKAALEETGHADHKFCASLMNKASEVPECIQNSVHQLCKKSYSNLICGVREINKRDIAINCSHTESLFKQLAEFFFTEDGSGEKFEYRHVSIRDLFAALYCVGEIREEAEIQEEAELETVLNAWVFGDISESSPPPLLDAVTPDHWKRLQGFIRFFLGLLPYAHQGLLSETPRLSQGRRGLLKSWFQTWIDKKPVKIKFFVFLHCVFELHDSDVTEQVSRHIQEAILFNIPLNSLDISALRYCFEKSRLDVIDLRLCELSDACLEQLEEVIRTCKDVKLSSNKLTAKSGEIFRRLLEHEECAIEKLWLGTNCVANSGTKRIFNGLEKNKSLRILSLKDNNISDFGTRSMAQSLKNNETLEELHLCMNLFGVAGIRNLKELKQDRPTLKIVVRIADDEGVLLYAEEKVQRLLSNGWKQYNAEWLLQLFDRLMADLNDDDELSHAKDAEKTERIESLKLNISELLKKIKPSEMIKSD